MAFKLRLKPETSSGVQINITGTNLTYKIGSGSAVSFTGGTGVVIPGNVGLDMITIEGVDVSLLRVDSTKKVIEAYLDSIESSMISLVDMFNQQSSMVKFECAADTSVVTSMARTWFFCRELKHFPKIDTSNVVDFNSTWGMCMGMLQFPQINTSNGVDFYSTWTWNSSLICIPQVDTTSATSVGDMFLNTNALVHPNASEQAALQAPGGAVYINKESTSPCYVPPIFKLRLKPETSAGVQLDIAGNNLSYQIGSGSVVAFIEDRDALIPGNVGLDMITIKGTDVSRIAVEAIRKVTEVHLDEIEPTLTTLNSLLNRQSELTTFTCTADTSSITTIAYAWNNCAKLTSFPHIDTSSVYWFEVTWNGCTSLTSFPHIDTSSGTSFRQAWNGCTGLTSFPPINTSSGTKFEATWSSCSSLTSFPYVDTSSGTNFKWAWNGCINLKCMASVDTSGILGASQTENMFLDTPALVHPNAAEQAALMGTGGYTYINREPTSPCYIPADFHIKYKPFTSSGIYVTITGDNLKYKRAGRTEVSFNSGSNISISGNSALDMITITGSNVTEISNERNINIGLDRYVTEAHLDSTEPVLTTLRNFLAGQKEMLTFTHNVDTSNITNMYAAWSGCSKLTSFSYMDTSNVTNLTTTWHSCSGLTSFPDIDTSKVDIFYYAWGYCSSLITSPNIDTREATDIGHIFRDCSFASIPHMDTSNVIKMDGAFKAMKNIKNVPVLNTSKVTRMLGVFSDCTSLEHFPGWDMSKVTHLDSMFKNCSNLKKLPVLNTSLGTRFGYLFYGCTSLKCIDGLDTRTTFGTQSYMFSNTPLLEHPNTNEQAALAGGPPGALYEHDCTSKFIALDKSNNIESITYSNSKALKRLTIK